MSKSEFIELANGMDLIWEGSFKSQDVLQLWYALIGHLPYEVASAAVQIHMRESAFPPKPANIIQNAERILPKNQRMTAQEAWALVSKAIRNGSYEAQQEYNKLPDLVKRCVGSPDRIREMALDTDYNEGVESSNFIKTYNELVKRQDEYDRLPDNVKLLIERSKVGLING